MAKSRFVCVTFIRTSPEKLWDALIKPEFTRQYWTGTYQESAWKQGAPWKIMIPDGRVGDSGEILAIEPPKRLVLSWRNEFMPDLKAEGSSRCTYEIEDSEYGVKLTVTHEMERAESKFIEAVAEGWPGILASLKSLLETGAPLAGTDKWPEGL